MTVEKANDFMDEDLLPDYLLPADSSLKKQRQNKELNFLTNLEMLHFVIMINAITLFLNAQRQSNEKTLLESLRHARDIEMFFKNLATLDAKSNQQIQLKKTQLEEIKFVLEKIDNSIKVINEVIRSCAERIRNLEIKLSDNEKKLNESFAKLDNIFEKWKDNIELFNFNKFEIDLRKLTGEHTGKINIGQKDLFEIISQAQNIFHSQHTTEEKYNLKDCLLQQLHKHVENKSINEDSNIHINTSHPVLKDVANNIYNDMKEIAGIDIEKAFNDYAQLKEENHQIKNEINMEKAEHESLVQQKSALMNARDLCNSMVENEKADLNIVKQFTGSIDNLINDLMNTPAPINISQSAAIEATENKVSEPDTAFTSPRFSR